VSGTGRQPGRPSTATKGGRRAGAFSLRTAGLAAGTAYDRGVTGEALGRRLLRLDAVYCAGAGLLAVALFGPLARLLEIPRLVPIVLGAAAVGWAVVVGRIAGLREWRRPVAAVAGANLVAALAIGALAAVAPTLAAGLLLAAVALEVAVFAVGQTVALRR
jgi:hypothetical protein